MHEIETIAWKTRNRYEQDLVTLGWTLALEDHPAGPEKDARAAFGAKVDTLVLDIQKLMFHLEVAQQSCDEASRRNKELQEELEYAQLSASLYKGEAELWKEQHNLHQQSVQFLVTFLDLFAFSQGKKVKRSQSFDLFPKSLLQLIDKIILFKIKNLNVYYFYYFSLIPTF